VICGGRFNFSPFEKGGGRGILRLFKKLNCYVLKGKIKAVMGKDSSQNLGPGGIWVVPSNHSHSVEYLEDTEAIEVVSPPRLDNFVGYTFSHTFFDE